MHVECSHHYIISCTIGTTFPVRAIVNNKKIKKEVKVPMKTTFVLNVYFVRVVHTVYYTMVL